MNVNVYLEDSLAKQVSKFAKDMHKPRNTIIREALKEWIAHHTTKKWSKTIMNFKGISKSPSFESYREELRPPKKDPFA